MTKDQVSELQQVSTEVQRWLSRGNLNDPPFDSIRRLAALATIAANVVEHKIWGRE